MVGRLVMQQSNQAVTASCIQSMLPSAPGSMWRWPTLAVSATRAKEGGKRGEGHTGRSDNVHTAISSSQRLKGQTNSCPATFFAVPKYGALLSGQLVYPNADASYGWHAVCTPADCSFGCLPFNVSPNQPAGRVKGMQKAPPPPQHLHPESSAAVRGCKWLQRAAESCCCRPTLSPPAPR
jgi:hypothetical protein